MVQLLKIIPVLYIGGDILFKLYRLLITRKNNRVGLIFVISSFLIFMWVFYESGIQNLYLLYESVGLGQLGVYMGVVLLPLGYHITRIVIGRLVRKEKMSIEKHRSLETVMSFIAYPAGSFLLFLLGFIGVLVFVYVFGSLREFVDII